MLQSGVPFNERGGTLRGALDLICGRFPRFVFGGGVARDTLPVFHFHDHTREELEPKLRYLAENGYRTVSCDEIAAFIDGNGPRGEKAVAICFDDAWASVWSVAAPLLKEFQQTAIVFAIPGRIDQPGSPFVTWEQLRTLHAAGLIDVQSHTFSHSRIFTGTDVAGFVTPAYADTPFLNRPQISPTPLRFIRPEDLGTPLYDARSRMSDGRRVEPDAGARARCQELVARAGGAAFFDRPDWRQQLEPLIRGAASVRETAAQHRAAIEDELARARDQLNTGLGTTSVRHICLPWGVSGQVTAAALERVGYRTAFANRLRGLHAVKAGDDPFWLKRLPNKYIDTLPGHGRRTWL